MKKIAPIKIGDKVWVGLSVYKRWWRTSVGYVVDICDGYYVVDVMSHHGGAPWLRYETFVELYQAKPEEVREKD